MDGRRCSGTCLPGAGFRRARSGILPALIGVCTVASCDRPPPDAPAPATTEQQAVIDAVERFFAAIGTGDTAEYRAQVVPEAMTFSVRVTPDGTGPVNIRSHAAMMPSLAQSAGRFDERMWDPTVRVHGPIALVWTPYEFRTDGQFSHCGIDSFELMKVSGAWKLTNAAWTAEAAGCDPGPPPRTESADEDRAAVLDVVQRMFTAMTARDTAAYAATLVPEATYFRIRVDETGTDTRIRTGAEDIAILGASSEQWVEHIRDPVVFLHPPLAVVWAPYDFHIDGRFSHCGLNIFQLMKIDGTWKLTTATWTVETAGCTAKPDATP